MIATGTFRRGYRIQWLWDVARAICLPLLLGIALVTRPGLAKPSTDIKWQRQDDVKLAAGVQLFRGDREAPKLRCYYLKIDLNSKGLALQPLMTSEQWQSFCHKRITSPLLMADTLAVRRAIPRSFKTAASAQPTSRQ